MRYSTSVRCSRISAAWASPFIRFTSSLVIRATVKSTGKIIKYWGSLTTNVYRGSVKRKLNSITETTAAKQLRTLVYPRGVFTIRMNQKPVGQAIVTAVSGFVFLYIVFVVISTIVVASSSTDFTTALTASLACIGNIGPGFGGVGPTSNFAFFPDYVKVWLAAIMILGRLEIYTVLILFTPIFYRK